MLARVPVCLDELLRRLDALRAGPSRKDLLRSETLWPLEMDLLRARPTPAAAALPAEAWVRSGS